MTPSIQVFEALGDRTRFAMVQMLIERDRPVSEMATPLNISLTATLKHIRILERAGLATSEKVGRERMCRFNPAPLDDMAEWANSVRAMWNTKLDALERFLARTEGDTP